MATLREKAGQIAVSLTASAALLFGGTACDAPNDGTPAASPKDTSSSAPATDPTGSTEKPVGYTPPPADATSFDIQFTQTDPNDPDSTTEVDTDALLERQAANPVDVLELDGADTDKSTITELNKSGIYTMCYLNAGAAEKWREDYDKFPKEALGKDYDGWEGEQWLDIRNKGIRSVIEARIKECAEKGFKAIDPDNLDAYQVESGFEISRDEQIEYLRWLSETSHKHGLAIVLKNAPDLVQDVANHFDGAVVENCHEWGECGSFEPLVEARKPVFLIGYPPEGSSETALADNAGLAATCKAAEDHSFVGVLKARELTEQSKICR